MYAHGIKRKPEIVSEGRFEVIFQTKPLYLVTGKNSVFEIVVNDTETGNVSSDLSIQLELHRKGIQDFVMLQGNENEPGHYRFSYRFSEKGTWEAHLIIAGQEFEKEVIFEVDNFGLSGALRSSIIFFLLFVLIMIAHKDCSSDSYR